MPLSPAYESDGILVEANCTIAAMSVVDESIRIGKVRSTPIFSGRSLADIFMAKIIGEQKTKLNIAE
jgi:hypothetical protein